MRSVITTLPFCSGFFVYKSSGTKAAKQRSDAGTYIAGPVQSHVLDPRGACSAVGKKAAKCTVFEGDKMLAMIDNFDSYTYNLVSYFRELGEAVTVIRRDRISPDCIEGSGGNCHFAGTGISFRRGPFGGGDPDISGQSADTRSLPRASDHRIYLWSRDPARESTDAWQGSSCIQ